MSNSNQELTRVSDPDSGSGGGSSTGSTSVLRDRQGWDGKLRVGKKAAVVANELANSDPERSDEEHDAEEIEGLPGEEIEADEDLLDDYEFDSDDIDLVHRGISSIPALDLQRFSKLERLCLRQNRVARIELPQSLGSTLKDLDLYDNYIGHLRGLDGFEQLTSLDLSFNRLKHIRNVGHLRQLRDLFLVQNKIAKIEGLEGLSSLRNLELGANRVREIENLDALTTLEELWLGKNKISELKNLSQLSNLRILSIQANRLSTLCPGLADLRSLEELYVSHNALTSLSGIESLTQLRVLDISSNQISRLENLAALTQLEEFWASGNQLSSFEDVERELGDKEKLETVYLEGNPLQSQNEVTYRNKVKLALPRVKQIDASTSSAKPSGVG